MPVVDPDCLFCKIVGGEIQAEMVDETTHSVAFRDLDPQAPTHVLVIPRQHIPTLPELAEVDPPAAADVLRLAKRVALAAGLEAGYRVVLNNGAAASSPCSTPTPMSSAAAPSSWPPG